MSEEKKTGVEPFDKDERDGMVRYFALLITTIVVDHPAMQATTRELVAHLMKAHGYTQERAKAEVLQGHAEALKYVSSAITIDSRDIPWNSEPVGRAN